jgi:hypothetical protein
VSFRCAEEHIIDAPGATCGTCEAEKKAYGMEKLYNAERITKAREIKRMAKEISNLRSQLGDAHASLREKEEKIKWLEAGKALSGQGGKP